MPVHFVLENELVAISSELDSVFIAVLIVFFISAFTVENLYQHLES